MWGTGADSTVERLLDTTSRAKLTTYNIVVLIYHSPIIQFLAGVNVKVYISIRP